MAKIRLMASKLKDRIFKLRSAIFLSCVEYFLCSKTINLELALNYILVPFLTVAIASTALAQEPPKPVHQQTTLPANARYEIIQSTLAARLAFRLDRYTGQIWQLVKTKDDDTIWEETPVHGIVQGRQNNRPRYQIFTSGFAARHTFLLDTDTGKTWVIVVSKRKSADGIEYEQNIWTPFPE